jgi:hypothetical protein
VFQSIASPIRVRRAVQGQGDRLQHAIDVAQDVVVPEPQNAIAVLCEPPIAHGIARVCCMLSAVDLDHQVLFATDEIDNVGPDRLLPDELVAAQAAGADAIPELLLRVGRLATQAARPLGLRQIGAAHVPHFSTAP